jgi:hypothetical protein
MSDRLTFDQLMARKLQREQDKVQFKEIAIPSGGKLLFEKPSEDDVFACIDMIGNGDIFANVIAAYDRLIYNCCPELKNKELHGDTVIIPTDIVKALFDVPDRVQIGNELVEMSGMSNIGEQIKKQ